MTIGVDAGLTSTNFAGDDTKVDGEDIFEAKSGFYVGASLGIPLGGRFGLGTGLYYVEKGADFVDGSGGIEFSYFELPVVLQMTCLSSSFHLPGLTSLDEGLLLQSGGGAVAVWGPTGLGLSTGHVELADGFVRSLIVDENPSLGVAALAGKVQLMTATPPLTT